MTPRAEVDLTAVLAALGDQGLTLVRAGVQPVQISGVELHTPSDPPPDPRALVLWVDAAADVPTCPAVVVREEQLDTALARLPDHPAVLSLTAGPRWADVLDSARVCLLRLLAQDVAQDLYDMADALALALGGAVAIEDADRRILAFSTVAGQPIDEVRRRGILGRRVPEHVERDEWYRRLWRASGPVQYEAGPESTPRLAIGLRSGGERVGSVWAVGDATTLQPHAETTLEQAAPGLAAALVDSQDTGARSREQRNRLLISLLATAPGPSVDRLLPAVVVGIRTDESSDVDDLLRTRVADILSLQAQRSEGTGLAGEVHGIVCAVLPWTSRERVESALLSLLRRAGVPRARAAVSEPVRPGGSLKDAQSEVDAMLTMTLTGEQDGELTVVFADQCRTQLLLAELADAVWTVGGLSRGPGARLAEHDAEHGTSYEETLQAWFDANGDVSRAAARLHVHANTLRYRWTRAATLFSLDLDDPDTRLLLHLELRLRSLGYRGED